MNKRADELMPGDIVYWYGERVTVEFVDVWPNTVLVRHTKDKIFCMSSALWLVELPTDDIVKQAELIIEER